MRRIKFVSPHIDGALKEREIKKVISNIYIPCPCGSGKKYKFCCYGIEDKKFHSPNELYMYVVKQGNKKEFCMHSDETVSYTHLDPIHQTMMSILQAFAESSGRYHNINIIANKNMNNDCIKRWKEEVDIELFRKKVSKRKKEKIEKNAKMVGALLDDNAVVNHISETGEGLYLSLIHIFRLCHYRSPS